MKGSQLCLTVSGVAPLRSRTFIVSALLILTPRYRQNSDELSEAKSMKIRSRKRESTCDDQGLNSLDYYRSLHGKDDDGSFRQVPLTFYRQLYSSTAAICYCAHSHGLLCDRQQYVLRTVNAKKTKKKEKNGWRCALARGVKYKTILSGYEHHQHDWNFSVLADSAFFLRDITALAPTRTTGEAEHCMLFI